MNFDLLRNAARAGWIFLEVIILSTLILAARCANYQDVFVAGNVYFTDADCYARMIRVRICKKNPGMIIRHHDFENFPQGTRPHTTAPLDYLILALAILVKPWTAQPLDLAGAIISPLLGLLGGWFLWWWSRRMRFRFRAAMLMLYALSPILVHGTELGRPDHQSLLMLLVGIAVCAEWRLQTVTSTRWSILSGAAWSLGLWVSLYEPLILLVVVAIFYVIFDRRQFTERARRIGWIAFASLLLVAFLVEQRLPHLPIFANDALLTHWSRSIGELTPVRVTDPIWFQWTGYLVAAAPLLVLLAGRKRMFSEGAIGGRARSLILVLLVATYFLTIWQARWAYFCVTLFALAIPTFLEPIKPRAVAWAMVLVSIYPILGGWDKRLWPNESELALRIQARLEAVQWRALASEIHSEKTEPFLAPWWLSPSAAYWSGQPAIAGSSHESLSGISDSARFFLTNEPQIGREILQRDKIVWVLICDSDRVLQNSALLLDIPIPAQSLGGILGRNPSRVPEFLRLAAQNGAGKLYRVSDFP
jgi:hypothetical protein